MRRLRLCFAMLAAVAGCAGCVLTPGAAIAAQSQATTDCNAHGKLTQRYSTAQLQTGLSTMPPDIKEYTDCYDVIQRALLAQVGSSHQTGVVTQGSSSGGSFLPTPLIFVLVILVLGAGAWAAVAARRRGGRENSGSDGGPASGP